MILPDSVRNYMSKFLSNAWMREQGFVDEESKEMLGILDEKESWWTSKPASVLKLRIPLTVGPNVCCGDCISLLKENAYDQVPVVDPTSMRVMGMVTLGNMLSKIGQGRATMEDPVSKCLFKQFKSISLSTPLGDLSRIFDRSHFVLVMASQQVFLGNNDVRVSNVVFGVATRIDLLSYIADSTH